MVNFNICYYFEKFIYMILYFISFRFQPFSVGMLAVEPGEDTSNVNCWMDIRKGRFPQVPPQLPLGLGFININTFRRKRKASLSKC